ncbi:MAG: SAV_2336 N-terminal domain-related protein, partial [Crocosphaera sp.]
SIPLEIQEIESEKPPTDSEKIIDVITKESPPIETETTRLTKGFPFQVPAAPALQTPLSLNRALRPLMRKVPSATKRILDEEATVNRIAERDIWQPVTKPQPERWLTLELVIEESRSSFIWRELVDDLQQLLENQGAFQTMRLWQVSSQNGQHLQLVRRRKKGQSGRRYHSHRELIHPSGRGLILLVSDCVSDIWKNALIYPWLKDWSEKQPVAIVQLFPERLWNSTQLARGRKLFITALTPGVANSQLVLKDYPRWLPLDWQNTLLVPVVTLEPEVLKQWSGVVAGVGQSQISAFLFDLAFIKQQISQVNRQNFDGRPRKAIPKGVETESGAENETETINIRGQAEVLVERFFATASEPAKSLATMMAAAPVSMPVVNLIRKTLLKEVAPVHVAEFYMGGLLKPIVENEDGQFRVYDFCPGVRQVLNESIGRRRTTEVLNAISQYIAEKIDRPIRSFAALLALLPQYSQKEQAQLFPFAQVAVEVLQNLGGEHAELAEEVADNLAKLDRPHLSDEEDKPFEPILSSCTFEVVTIELEETRTVEFVVATIERQSQVRLWWEFWKSSEKWVIKPLKRQATSIIEVLPEGLELELMEIPGGTFWMGTDDGEIERLVKKFDWEYFKREKPQHLVTLQPFSMGRYPITQGQWKAIAEQTNLQVNTELDPDPSQFKDDPPHPILQLGEPPK